MLFTQPRSMSPPNLYKNRICKGSWHQAEVRSSPQLKLSPLIFKSRSTRLSSITESFSWGTLRCLGGPRGPPPSFSHHFNFRYKSIALTRRPHCILTSRMAAPINAACLRHFAIARYGWWSPNCNEVTEWRKNTFFGAVTEYLSEESSTPKDI